MVMKITYDNDDGGGDGDDNDNDNDDGVDDVYVAFNLIGFADAHPDLQLQQNLIETAFLQFSDLNQYISHSSGCNAKNEKSKHEKILPISMAVKW